MQKNIGAALVPIFILAFLFGAFLLFWYLRVGAPLEPSHVDVQATTTLEYLVATTTEVAPTTTSIALPIKPENTSGTSTKQVSTPTIPKPKVKAYPVAQGATDAERMATFGKKLMGSPAWGPENGRSVIFDASHLVITEQPPLPDADTIPYPESEIDHIYINTKSDLNVNGWKTFTNPKYHFTFKYPSDWVFKSGEKMLGQFFDSTGKHFIAEVNVTLYDTANEPMNTLLEWTELQLGHDIFGYVGKEKIILRTIVDDETTLGYFSQWKVVIAEWLGWPFIETRLDFEDKTQKALTNDYGTYRIVVFIKNSTRYNDADVLEHMASTFRFTGE